MSQELRETSRSEALPIDALPMDALPIDALRSAFEAHPPETPLVISAPTGSGKSTQIPRWCAARLETPVLVIEPRRVACRSLASRVAELESVTLGVEVGYTVRDEDRTHARTKIRFVTTGVALRMWSQDQLARFGAVIIDEFHERNLELDLLLALCHSRPRAQLIVMSATFAADALASHLSGVHLSGAGRLFDVTLEYHPHQSSTPSALGLMNALPDLIEQALARAPLPGGDVLVFLPGKGEINEARSRLSDLWRALKVHEEREALMLYGGLTLEEQSAVFKRGSRRRVILSTNVAETSLTVPGVSVVIDSGLVRRTRYDRGRGALALAEIAHDSAEQRRGRAGRLGPGLCLRMWSRGATLKPYTAPEIHRESLTTLVLAAGACGVSVRELPFVDPPREEALANAEAVLTDLGALDAQHGLTACGHALFGLGVEVSLGRWLVEGLEGGPLDALIDLVSALSCSRPLFKRGGAPRPEDELRARGCDAVGMIRALRVPIADAGRYHLNREALVEARRHRERLCRGLGPAAQRPQRLDPWAPIDRRGLALALLRADPRSAYVLRERRGREAWCGRGPELKLGQETGLTLARLDDSTLRCEALVVLDQHAQAKRGRQVDHLIVAAMPVPLAWLKSAGLGEERIGAAKLTRGKLKVEVERVFAKRILERSEMTPTGERAREALTRCLLEGQRWRGVCDEISARLARLALAWELNQHQRTDIHTRGSENEHALAPPTDVEAWLLTCLHTLGFEESSDLELIERADLLPPSLSTEDAEKLDKAFPAGLNLSDARYVFHYEVARRRVVMEQVAGSRREPPRAEWLPKCGGFEIRFKRGQHDSMLRRRKSRFDK